MSKDFKPQDYFRYKKLREKWRKPKGLQSKMRLGIKGAGKKVKIGYRTAKQLRYLVGGVIKAKIVKSPKDLNGLKDDSIIIASSLGKKKVLEIFKEAEKRKIMILNKKSVKSAKEREEKIKQVKELRKKAKKEQKKEKAESKEQSKEMEKKNK